jgi:hypothetical protein
VGVSDYLYRNCVIVGAVLKYHPHMKYGGFVFMEALEMITGIG